MKGSRKRTSMKTLRTKPLLLLACQRLAIQHLAAYVFDRVLRPVGVAS